MGKRLADLFRTVFKHLPGIPYLLRHQLIAEVLAVADERGLPQEDALRVAVLVELEIAPRHSLATARDILALHLSLDAMRASDTP